MADDLLIKQDALQKEAEEVLEKLDLLNLLSKYGKPEIVGSFALGLMTRRDIDIEITTKNLSRELCVNFISELFKAERHRLDVELIDNRNNSSIRTPKGLYIGVVYYDHLPVTEQKGSNPLVWQIDLHFLAPNDSRGGIYTKKIKKQLTDKDRKNILEIKNAMLINKEPKYRKEFFSIDIYEAVLNRGVKNLEEFKKYLAEKNIILAGA